MLSVHQIRGWIASRNGKFFASKLAAVADKYLKAYNNLGNVNMAYNGEVDAFRLVLDRVKGDVIDAGANEGQWALAVHGFAQCRTIHSFEPVPQTFAKLKENVEGRIGIVPVNAGLGDEEQDLTFQFNSSATVITSAYPLIDWQDGAESVVCRVITGDRYLAENRIETVALLKIDVEGMEAKCLSGFEQSIRTGRVATIQFEHGPSHVHSGHTLKYFLDWLDDKGFTVFRIFPGRLSYLQYDIRRESYEVQNLIAIRRDVLPQLGL